ncbi:hypothetical protein D3C76_908000 [compost metagenome]
MQGFEKLVGQFQVALHPALARGMGEVQVQPEKLLGVLRVLQVLQGPGRIDLLAALTGAKTETVKQAEQIRIAMAVIDAVVHEGSHGGRLSRVLQVHVSRIIARLDDGFVTSA